MTCVSEGDLVAGSSSAITLETVVTAERGSTISIDAAAYAADPTNEATTANNSDSSSVAVDSLPMTGVDAVVLGQIAALLIAVGLAVLVLSGRRESTGSIAHSGRDERRVEPIVSRCHTLPPDETSAHR